MVWEGKRQENTLHGFFLLEKSFTCFFSGEKNHINSGEFPKVIQDEKSDLLEVK